jgi:hypothetical protein
MCARVTAGKGGKEGVDRGGIECRKARKGARARSYPLDADLAPSASGTGYASTFSGAGFRRLHAGCRLARSCATI